MPDRLVGLVGKGKGSRLYTSTFRNMHVSIRGLGAGDVVKVKTDNEVFEFHQPGNHKLPSSDWVEFEGQGECKNLICSVRENY